jgi:predicted membrane metal-binding protein
VCGFVCVDLCVCVFVCALLCVCVCCFRCFCGSKKLCVFCCGVVVKTFCVGLFGDIFWSVYNCVRGGLICQIKRRIGIE